MVLLRQWGSDGEVLKVLAVIWEKNSRHKGPPYLFILTIGRETEAHQEKEEATQGYPGRRKLPPTKMDLYRLLTQHTRHPASQPLLLSPSPSQAQDASQFCLIILQSWLSSSLERFRGALHTAVLIFP